MSGGDDMDRVWTIPNVLSFLRLLGIPLYLWLILGPGEDGWAVVVLVVAGLTDWLDGQIARRTNTITRLGQMLDPIADRLYILAIIVSLAIRDLIPWWLVVLLALRDVMLAFLLPSLRRRGYTSLPVHLLGKIATFCLMYAFPLVLLGGAQADGVWGTILYACHLVGWAFALWGTALYWWAGLLYVWQLRSLVASPTTSALTGS